jgi:DAK2 domain fusion protein YloV
MPTLEHVAAADLAAAMGAYRDVLRSHEAYINRLNVFPVPDGDTGTNMALTLESVVAELAAGDSREMPSVVHSISHGSLMGARGNSGVILSQVLRSLAHSADGGCEIDCATFADGLAKAADAAYAAVQKPVEGTILTVARAAAEGAGDGRDSGLVPMLEAARERASEALRLTPELLPVLKTAGVVDSGGAGLLLLFDAFLHVADGRDLPEPPFRGTDAAAVPGKAAPGTDLLVPRDLRYEVMYILEAPDELMGAFREVWAGIGDSIVVVGASGVWNCHIHTDDIGAAVEAALEAGRPRNIRVTDLAEEVEEEGWVRQAAGSGDDADTVEERVRCAIVAVCTGDGIRRIFRSLGVHHVVSGGQSMNPSTVEILEAVEATNAEQVVILPNNKNIVPVAEQAASMASKPVRVIPTRGIQEGFAALLEFDPEGDADSNVALMSACASRVVAGEVTRAVRPGAWDGGPIAEGDYLGLSRTGIEVVAPDLAGSATGLLSALIDADHHEVVTVISGEGSGAADTRRVTEWLSEHHPEIEAEVHHGGQPLYPYLFSIE